MDGDELRTGMSSFSHPQEPLYSNFPWFNCMARSERRKKTWRDQVLTLHKHQILNKTNNYKRHLDLFLCSCRLKLRDSFYVSFGFCFSSLVSPSLKLYLLCNTHTHTHTHQSPHPKLCTCCAYPPSKSYGRSPLAPGHGSAAVLQQASLHRSVLYVAVMLHENVRVHVFESG